MHTGKNEFEQAQLSSFELLLASSREVFFIFCH